MPENQGFNADILPSYSSVTAHTAADNGEPRNPRQQGSDSKNKLKSSYYRTKSELQENKHTRSWFPPSGAVSTALTLGLTALIVFLSARVVMGKIADVGGTIFALLVLILLALAGGKIIQMSSLLFKKCGFDLQMPPLLGMLIVGIIIKNVPYNFGQFGRAECTRDHMNGSFVDSLHEFIEDPEDRDLGYVVPHFSEVKNVTGDVVQERIARSIDTEDAVLRRIARSAGGHGHDSGHAEDEAGNDTSHDCKERYFGHDLDPFISRTLRSICLTVILLMAGLELDPVKLLKLSGMVVRATFIPCLTEAVAVAVLSNLLLGFPWTVGFMLGFILAAVSPAVIIPSLMSLSGRGYGVAKGIPTLVIAACAADDVVAISGFGIFFGITFSKGAPLWKLILHGPIEVVIGVSFGIFWGLLAQWIPHKDHRHVAFFRWLILFGGGLIALFGAHLIHYDGAGGLATIIMAFVAGIQWRREGWGDHNPVTKTFQRMWIILQPVIFALIGTEIQVDKINFQTLGMSILVLFIALIIRMVGTYVAVMGGELNVKEKIFMAFAWLPKATVQAALGPIFLDNVKALNAADFEQLGDQAEWLQMGNDILTLAVLSILITAPLGAVSILALGPRLLEQDEVKTEDAEESLDMDTGKSRH